MGIVMQYIFSIGVHVNKIKCKGRYSTRYLLEYIQIIGLPSTGSKKSTKKSS